MTREFILSNFYLASDLLFHLSSSSRNRDFTSLNQFAEGLVRKFYLSSLSLRRHIQHDQYQSILDGQVYNYVIDPITAASTTRTMYESMLTFFHVYADSPNHDERQLRFYFWQLSSIISQLKTEPTGSKEDAEFRDQKEKDKQELINLIKALPIVGTLSNVSKNKIEQKNDPNASTKWEYYVDGTELKDVGGITGIQSRLKSKPNTFNNFYSIFSTDAHATFSSVKKVLEAFEVDGKEEPDNFKLLDSIVFFATSMTILLIHDYCSYFPEVKSEFDKLQPEYIEFINSYIESIKGAEYRL